MDDMTHKTVPVEPIIANLPKAIWLNVGELDPLAAPYDFGFDIKYVRADLAEAAQPSPVTELEVMLYEALRAFRDGGPEGGTDFNGWHQSYEEPCRLAREALAAFNAKKGAV